MKTHFAKIQEIVDGTISCPFPISVIPNYMGINLCSVDSIVWTVRDDSQIVSISINFVPSDDAPMKPENENK